MEIVRLGEGVDRTGRLAPEAIERTRVALADYAAQIAALGAANGCGWWPPRPAGTRPTPTSSGPWCRPPSAHCRRWSSGDEEARLSFAGAVRGLPFPGPYLVVDIGGGSTEFVVGRCAAGRSTVDDAISVDIGCVRMTERHLHDDPPTAGADRCAATADIEAAVDRALAAVDWTAGRHRGRPGRVGDHGRRHRARPRRVRPAAASTTRRIPTEQVRRVTADLLAMTRQQRLAIPVMHPGRADVIGAGALILRIVLDRLATDAVVASEHDILDGIAYSLL